jgi:hypothetical protein
MNQSKSINLNQYKKASIIGFYIVAQYLHYQIMAKSYTEKIGYVF